MVHYKDNLLIFITSGHNSEYKFNSKTNCVENRKLKGNFYVCLATEYVYYYDY